MRKRVSGVLLVIRLGKRKTRGKNPIIEQPGSGSQVQRMQGYRETAYRRRRSFSHRDSVSADRSTRVTVRERVKVTAARLRLAGTVLIGLGIATGMLGVYGTEQDAPLLFALALGGILLGTALRLLVFLLACWAALYSRRPDPIHRTRTPRSSTRS